MGAPLAIGPLGPLGWDAGFDASFGPHRQVGRTPGRVVAVHKETSIVRDADGDRPARVSGRFRFEALSAEDYPVVGDWVALEPSPATGAGGGSAVIAAVLPRRGTIRRSAADASRRGSVPWADEQVLAANVDLALIVAGLDGDLNVRRLERYVAVAWSGGTEPLIVLNKADLAHDLPRRLAAVEAVAPGVRTVAISALTGAHLHELTPLLIPGRTAIVMGSSGVGKSTLVNALLGDRRQRTRPVREDDSRGRHTTTHRELFALPGGALLIDTPGLRALEVTGADGGVELAFDDVSALSASCRFADCHHEGEPGCAVLQAVALGGLTGERLASWRKLRREAAHHERRQDPLARIEERRRWKAVHKSVRRQMQDRYGADR